MRARLVSVLIVLALLSGCTSLPSGATSKPSTSAAPGAPDTPPTAPNPLQSLPGELAFLGAGNITFVSGGTERSHALPAGLQLASLSPVAPLIAGTVGDDYVLIRPETGETTKLAPAKGRSQGVWSPDGSLLAVLLNEGGTQVEVYDREGGLVKKVPVAARVRNPEWAPGNRYLLLGDGPGESRNMESWLVDLTLGISQPLGKGVTGGAWAPDGLAFAYVKTSQDWQSEVRVRTVNGQDRVVMTWEILSDAHPDLKSRFQSHRIDSFKPIWSALGERVALGFKVAGGDPRFGVATFHPDGSVLATFVLPFYPDHPGQDKNVLPRRPCSPKGLPFFLKGAIAVPMAGPGCDGQVALLDARTLQPLGAPLADLPGTVTASPDGKWLLVTAPDGGSVEAIPADDPSKRVKAPVPGKLLRWTAGAHPLPATAAKIPGRLLFKGDEALTVIESGTVRDVPLPKGFRPASLSPDGSLVYGYTGQGESLQLAVMPAGGGPLRVLGPGAGIEAPAWSPDGRSLAYFHGRTVTVMPVDGGGARSYPLDFGRSRQLTWSPDGKQIAANVGPPLVTGQELWLLDLGTGKAESLGQGTLYAQWSPDAKYLAYVTYVPEVGSRLMVRGDGTLRMVLNGPILARLQPDVAWLFEKNAMHLGIPRWTPDSQSIGIDFKAAGGDPRSVAVTLRKDGTELKAWILPLDKTQPNQSPPLPCHPRGLFWSPQADRVILPMGGPSCEGKMAILKAGTLQPEGDFLPSPKGSRAHLSPDRSWIGFFHPNGNPVLFPIQNPSDRVELPVKGEPLGWMK